MKAGGNRIWVVVANATTARLFHGADDGKSIVEFETLAHPAGRLAGREIASDAPGGSFNTARGGWHATASESALKQHELETFAIEIARRLESGRTQGACATLALIVAPALLGELRARLSAPTGAIVAHAIDKNLVHAGISEIVAALPPRFLRAH